MDTVAAEKSLLATAIYRTVMLLLLEALCQH
jgi:hypothetical protein